MSSILIRDPFADFDHIWQRALGAPLGRRRHSAAPSENWQLPVNVFDSDAGIGIEAWLPGFSEDEIAVTVDDDQLRIHAEHVSDASTEGKPANGANDEGKASDANKASDAGSAGRNYRRREVASTVLSRSFRLDPSYDASRISARLSNGVLELTLPKAEQPEPQRIKIDAGAV